jgi:hypothetical protein
MGDVFGFVAGWLEVDAQAVVRNAHGVIHDINENFTHGPGHRLRKRYRYVYALFSASGFTQDAQDFALAQQISLVDLSSASFAWLRCRVEATAADPLSVQREYRVDRFPVNWMRGQLRRLLGTLPDMLDDEGEYPETTAYRFSQAALPVLHTLAGGRPPGHGEDKHCELSGRRPWACHASCPRCDRALYAGASQPPGAMCPIIRVTEAAIV